MRKDVTAFVHSLRRVWFFLLALFLPATLIRGQSGSSSELSGIVDWPAPLLWRVSTEESSLPRDLTPSRPLAEASVPTSPLPLIGITPCRIADTRGNGFTGQYGPPALAAGSPRSFVLTGQCGIPVTAQAVSLNVTVTNTQGAGDIRIYPEGTAEPLVSTLNYVAGQTLANAAVVPLGTGGGISVVADVHGANLILDTNGYYDASGLITQVSPGTGLTGGGTSGNVTLAIAAGGVIAGDLASNSVTSSKIAANAVTAGAIAPGQVVKSVNGLFDGVTLAAGSNVTINKSGQTLTFSASGGASGWGLSGNSGLGCTTSPCASFLGTTDANDALEVHVNGARALRIEPTDSVDAPNFVAGWNASGALPGVKGATIGGGGFTGEPNLVTDDDGTIGGGSNNQAGDNAGTTSDAQFATVGGGRGNKASWVYATVGGGFGNSASDGSSTVGGGFGNTASSGSAVVSGGVSNVASGYRSTVSGGSTNKASGDYSAVAGGAQSVAGGQFAMIAGGFNNGAYGVGSFAAGRLAQANGDGDFIWGDGSTNFISSTAPNQFLVLATGGFGINTNAPAAALDVAGMIRSSTGGFKFPDGTTQTTAGLASVSHDASLTGNGTAGSALGIAAGGVGTSQLVANGVTAPKIAVGQVVKSVNGLFDNVTLAAGTGLVLTASGQTLTLSSVASGWGLSGNPGTGCTTTPCTDFLGTLDNDAIEFRVNNRRAFRIEPATDSSFGFSPNVVGGFEGNGVAVAGVAGATIAGGGAQSYPNRVFNSGASILGGINNSASGYLSVVGGGSSNTASGDSSNVVSGGVNLASGNAASVAGGRGNTASGDYSAVAGGLGNSAGGTGSLAAGRSASANSDGCFVWSDGTGAAGCGGPGFPNRFVVLASGGTFFYSNSTGTTGVILQPGSGSWSSVSDRNLKENFEPVDGIAVLRRLLEIPISTWNYKGADAPYSHLGPMAQDFYSAFHLGEDDRHITTIDEEGVALAAIQGLSRIVEEKDAKIRALEARLDALEKMVRRAAGLEK